GFKRTEIKPSATPIAVADDLPSADGLCIRGQRVPSMSRVARCAIWCCCALLTAWGPRHASAQTATPLGVDIPAQSLPDALDEYARQTGLQVIYVSEITSGLQSKRATKGSTAQAALAQLLAGTGLQYKFLNAKTVQLLIAAPIFRAGIT